MLNPIEPIQVQYKKILHVKPCIMLKVFARTISNTLMQMFAVIANEYRQSREYFKSIKLFFEILA